MLTVLSMFSVFEQVLLGFILFTDGLIQDQLQHIQALTKTQRAGKQKLYNLNIRAQPGSANILHSNI